MQKWSGSAFMLSGAVPAFFFAPVTIMGRNPGFRRQNSRMPLKLVETTGPELLISRARRPRGVPEDLLVRPSDSGVGFSRILEALP
jgi:hypothetical protein